jgi:hypothetical protein
MFPELISRRKWPPGIETAIPGSFKVTGPIMGLLNSSKYQSLVIDVFSGGKIKILHQFWKF